MSVGSEVQAACKKCGDGWHVVIAMADGEIANVECKQCNARHRFRSPTGSKATKKKATRKKATTTRARKTEKKTIIEADESRPRRDFSMSETYQVGDRVVHTSFGEGVVQEVPTPAKIVVLFEVGSKMLVQGRGNPIA